MSARIEARHHEAVAAVVSAGQNLFFNSPDVAHVILQANVSAQSFVTVISGALSTAPILGLPNTNRYFNAATTIADLGSSKFLLKQPIPVLVEQTDEEEWLATFVEAEISRSGNTPHDAVDWLRSSVVQLFELFKGERELGPLPEKQFGVLRRYIVEKSDRQR